MHKSLKVEESRVKSNTQHTTPPCAEELDLVALSAKGAAAGASAAEAGRVLGWKPKNGAAAPKPKFGWDAPSEAALVALLHAQLRLQDKHAEWVKTGLPDQLAASLQVNIYICVFVYLHTHIDR